MILDYKILEEKMSQLSPEMQSALTSIEVSQAVQNISKKYDLKIDQEGILFDHVAYMMLGLLSSEKFVSEFSKESQINEEKSRLIAQDINEEVFNKIRTSMRQIESYENEDNKEETGKLDSSIPAIEQAGGFSIEKDTTPNNKTRPDGSWKMPEEGDIELPEEILKHIEEHQLPAKKSPESIVTPIKPIENTDISTSITAHSTPLVAPNVISQKSSSEKDTEKHVEPLVDHLLTKATAIPLEKSQEHIHEEIQKPLPPTKNKVGPDMYREAIE